MQAADNEKRQERHTLSKAERLNHRKHIDRLFASPSKAMTAFPLRMVYLPIEPSETLAPATFLVSVSKRRFKRAVQRNRIKRQLREAYRLHKCPLLDALQTSGQSVIFAFIYVSDDVLPYEKTAAAVATLLSRLAEQLSAQ
jgi:ribonuclease P protein component